MTAQLEVLGQAIANFKHIGFEEAMGKVQAGLMGRGKGLKEFGIVVSAAMPIQERFNAMMREGSNVIDQMGDRANDRKNALQEFWGRLEAIQIMFAQQLPAPVESFFSQVNVALVALQTAWTSWSTDVNSGAEAMTNWGQDSGQSIGIVQKGIGYLVDTWQVLTVAFENVKLGFNTVIFALAKGINWIIEQVTSIPDLFAQAFNSALEFMRPGLEAIDAILDTALRPLNDLIHGKVGSEMPKLADQLAKMKMSVGEGGKGSEFLSAFADNMYDAMQDNVTKIKEDFSKPWSSAGIGAAFDKAREDLKKRRSDIASSAIASAAGTIPWAKAKAAKGAGEYKFAGALDVGSQEAASTIMRSKLGIGSGDDMKKIGVNSEKQTALLESINDHLSQVSANTDGEFELADF
jgi:hypothetical protein